MNIFKNLKFILPVIVSIIAFIYTYVSEKDKKQRESFSFFFVALITAVVMGFVIYCGVLFGNFLIYTQHRTYSTLNKWNNN